MFVFHSKVYTQWMETPEEARKRRDAPLQNTTKTITAPESIGIQEQDDRQGVKRGTQMGKMERRGEVSTVKQETARDQLEEEDFPAKRSGARYVRGMEMGSSGFHADLFSADFGDFTTTRKRARGSLGFHGDTFSSGFGDFSTMKRGPKNNKYLSILHSLPEDSTDTETGGERDGNSDYLGNSLEEGLDFEQSLRGNPKSALVPQGGYGRYRFGPNNLNNYHFNSNTFSHRIGETGSLKKRRPAAGTMGFHDDTFSQGFGEFETLKKRRPPSGTMGFHEDTFSQGFGDFDPYRKRSDLDFMGINADVFPKLFVGDASQTRRKPTLSGSMGFFGDTFSQGFGSFDMFKKRSTGFDTGKSELNVGAGGMHESNSIRDFIKLGTHDRKRSDLDLLGVKADIFPKVFVDGSSNRRKPVSGAAMEVHGETFTDGFGGVSTYRKKRSHLDSVSDRTDGVPKPFEEEEQSNRKEPTESEHLDRHSDSLGQGVGSVNSLKETGHDPEINLMSLKADYLNKGGGNFGLYRKKRTSTGFTGINGGSPSKGFGDYNTYKKRRETPGLQGDGFNNEVDANIYKKTTITKGQPQLNDHDRSLEKDGG